MFSLCSRPFRGHRDRILRVPYTRGRRGDLGEATPSAETKRLLYVTREPRAAAVVKRFRADVKVSSPAAYAGRPALPSKCLNSTAQMKAMVSVDACESLVVVEACRGALPPSRGFGAHVRASGDLPLFGSAGTSAGVPCCAYVFV